MQNWTLWQLRLLLRTSCESLPLGSFWSKFTWVEMGIPWSGNSREPEEGDIGKNELDLGIEDSIRRCEMLLAMVPQAMEIYMANGSVFLFPWKNTKTKILSCTENRSSIKPFSSWFCCSMALFSIKCLCTVTVYSIRELNQCMGILNLICVLLWRNMEKEKAQCFVDCATRLSMWWESSGNRVFSAHRNREFKTLVLLLWFFLVCCRWIFMGQVRRGANRKTK